MVTRKPIGWYHDVRGNERRRVDVYLMRVTNVLENSLEDDVRRRRWMRTSDAAEYLREELCQLIHRLEANRDS